MPKILISIYKFIKFNIVLIDIFDFCTKCSFTMKKIRTIYFAIILVVCIALGIIVVIPEIIPSLEFVEQIIILILYLINIVCVYVLIVRLKAFLSTKMQKGGMIALTSLAIFSISIVLFFSFIITSFSIGQGFLGGSLNKELKYPKHNVTIYFYDDGFLDPLTTIKIDHKIWPIMEDLSYFENRYSSEIDVVNLGNKVKLTSDNIVVEVDLKNRTAVKSYLD